LDADLRCGYFLFVNSFIAADATSCGIHRAMNLKKIRRSFAMTRAVVRVVAACLGFGLTGLSGAQTTLTRTSAFEYDPVSGLLIREIIEPNDSALCLVTTYHYDTYGNKDQATTRNCNGTASGGVTEAPAPTGDPVFVSRGSSTTYAAGSTVIGATTYSWVAGQFPTTSTNALQQQETKEFDPRFGTVTKLTGPNGLVTTWAYDGFGRKINETRSDGTQTNWTYTLCGVCPTFGRMFVTETSLTGTTPNAPTKKIYYDSLNREIRSEVEGFDGTAVYKDTEYDSLGRVLRVSKPYFAGASIYWTTYQYDILGRVTQVEEPATTAGTTRTVTAYNALITTVTVSNAGAGTNMPEGVVQTRVTTKNSQGQVVQVTDVQGNNVTYTYDPFSNLKITNAGGVTTSLGYDLRGRKTSMNDPDMGSWSYVYNALGELIRQTDAKSQVTTMAYDKLGRMTSRTEPDLVSSWFYDAYQGGGVCNKGIGKLCQVTATNNYARTLTYDAQGRLATLSASIDTSYQVSFTYDTSGRLNTTTYPQTGTTGANAFAVQNVYNARGYLLKVQRFNDADTTIYWTANSKNAAGQITSELLGNGLTTTYTYDVLFRQSAVQSANASGAVHSHTYGFDAIGNVIQRIDSVQAITENFSFDKLNRLLSASGPGLTTRSFNYNAIGNMTYKSDVGTYTYPLPTAARPHAVSSVSNAGAPSSITATYGYDLNGSLISTSGTIYPASGASVTFSRTLTYTSFNTPATIAHTQGASSYSYTYTYSVEHERVRLVTVRPDDTLTSIYLHPGGKGALLYEKEIRQSDGRVEHKHYVTGGSGLVGVFVTKTSYSAGEGPQMRYYHRDHLGSIAVITNPTGAVLERLSYEAYGERRNANGTPQNRASPLIGVTTDRGYTGHEHLDELNLIHMNGRVYDPALGRFMTADVLVDGAGNLQGYNRYSYVSNNPLMYTDPSGYSRLSKALHKVGHAIEKAVKSEVGRFVIAAVAAWAVGPLATEWLMTAAADSIAAGGIGGAFMTVGAEAGVLTPLGTAVVGAGTGFAAGFAASGGNVDAGLRGALSGAMMGGISGHFGSTYGMGRVLAESTASGISSELSGGSFRDGFRRGFEISALSYVNFQLRDAMKSQSRLQPCDPLCNSSGKSVGLFGDGFKLAGTRLLERAGNLIGIPQFGGVQGGQGSFFDLPGTKYGPGDLLDRVAEAWAGPHDAFNNMMGAYNPLTGNAIDYGGLRYYGGEAASFAGVLIVAPVAVGGYIRSEGLPVGIKYR
jgi:RHS repeat-associated protein